MPTTSKRIVLLLLLSVVATAGWTTSATVAGWRWRFWDAEPHPEYDPRLPGHGFHQTRWSRHPRSEHSFAEPDPQPFPIETFAQPAPRRFAPHTGLPAHPGTRTQPLYPVVDSVALRRRVPPRLLRPAPDAPRYETIVWSLAPSRSLDRYVRPIAHELDATTTGVVEWSPAEVE